MRYLFDTNAVRCIPSAQLEAARESGNELLLSPISFWELVCHLGERPFPRPRGNVRKARLFTVLDDPFAEIAVDLGCAEAVNPDRFGEREAVLSVLAALGEAESYEQLAAKRVTVHGEGRLVGDIAASAEATFNAERRQFLAALRVRRVEYAGRYGHDGMKTLTGEPFAREATNLAHGLRADMVGAGCDVSFADVASRTVLGGGYIVARVCDYDERGVADDKFEGNDLEDYFLSLHLGFKSGRTLVTNDEGLRSAINRTVAALRAYAEGECNSSATTAEVITSDQFLARIGVARA